MGILDIAEALDEDRETKGPVQLARRSQEMLMGIIESHRLGGLRVSLRWKIARFTFPVKVGNYELRNPAPSLSRNLQ